MGFDDGCCNTGLVLGLGINSSITNHHHQQIIPKSTFEPSLTLALPGDQFNYLQSAAASKKTSIDVNKGFEFDESAGFAADHMLLHRDQASSHSSAVSSFSEGRVKRERDVSSEEIEVERFIVSSSRASDNEDEDGVNARKKLRLTKEQSALLEESFKQHSTLNPKQKQALARQLSLRPRQVEVWFQNRRARTKLKQTEVDCDFLKKCCETLTDENRRLHKELQELKALKLSHQSLYMHMPAATLSMCPSCERIGGGGTGMGDGKSKAPFPMAPKPHCYTPFTNPSAAC